MEKSRLLIIVKINLNWVNCEREFGEKWRTRQYSKYIEAFIFIAFGKKMVIRDVYDV